MPVPLSVSGAVTVFQKSLSGTNAGWPGLTLVAKFLQGSGGVYPIAGATRGAQVRVTLTFKAFSAGAQMTACYIGRSSTDGSDNSIAFNGDQVQLKFGGSNSITGDGSTLSYVSDWADLPADLDITKTLNCATQFAAGGTISIGKSAAPGVSCFYKSGADAATTAKSGYTSADTAGNTCLVSKIEVQGPAHDYFGDNGATFPWYSSPTYPSAAYDSNTNATGFVWEAFISSARRVLARQYNHTTGRWSGIFVVGQQPLANDDHGDPSIMRDPDGYWHIFRGPHATGALKHDITTAPDDFSAWSAQTDLGTGLTYSAPVMVGSTLHLFTRTKYATDWVFTHYAATLSAGVATWGSGTDLINAGATARIYWFNLQRRGTDIHMVFAVSDGDKTYIRGLYYLIYKTADGSLSNFDGSHVVSAGSLPIDITAVDTYFRIFAQPHPSGSGSGISLAFDSLGRSHILMSDAATVGAAVYDLYHAVGDGTWTALAKIAEIPGNNSDVALVPELNGSMSAYYPKQAGSFGWGGDMYRRNLRSGSWAAPQLVRAAATRALNEPVALVSPHASCRLTFAEVLQDSLDSTPGIGTLKMYAMGDA